MLVGGKRHGAVVEATVLENVPSDCHVACDEVFGPVMLLDRYATFKDAVARWTTLSGPLTAFTGHMFEIFQTNSILQG